MQPHVLCAYEHRILNCQERALHAFQFNTVLFGESCIQMGSTRDKIVVSVVNGINGGCVEVLELVFQS